MNRWFNPSRESIGGAAHSIKHFALSQISQVELEPAKRGSKQVDEEMLHMRKLFKTPLHDLDLSVRAYNLPQGSRCEILGDLVHSKFQT